MAGPKARKPPEGGSAKGARKASAGSLQFKPVAEAPPVRGNTPADLHERIARLCDDSVGTAADPEQAAKYRTWAAEERRKAVRLRVGAGSA